MKTAHINNFLDSLSEDKKNFVEVYGTEKLFDPKFMLIADAVGESKGLLAEVILEKLSTLQRESRVKSTYANYTPRAEF